MKRILAALLSAALLLTACAGGAQGDGAPDDNPDSPQSAPAAESPSADPEEPADDVPWDTDEPADPGEGEETALYDRLLTLYEPARGALLWYYGAHVPVPRPESEEDPAGYIADTGETNAYIETLFTREFCEAVLYTRTPAASEDPRDQNKEDELGLAWELTERYYIPYKSDELCIVSALATADGGEREKWSDFVLRQEDGEWKLASFFEYSPYREYQELAAPAMSSGFGVFEWDDITDLEPYWLLSYYLYHYLRDVEGYSDAVPYITPVDEMVEKLSRHFNGVTREMLIRATEGEYNWNEYDAQTDTIRMPVTFDSTHFVVLGVDEGEDGGAVLRSLFIGKDGVGDLWGFLTVQREGDHLRYLSNRREEFPA